MIIADLQAFVAFTVHGSLSRAAAHLQTSQPSITRRIQRLESTVGGHLLDRSVKPARLSPLGVRLYEHAKRVLHEVDGIRDLIAQDATPSGAIRVGAVQSIAHTVGVPAVTLLKRRFPKLRIEMQCDWSLELVKKVQLGQIDVAAVMLPVAAQLPDRVSGDEMGIHRAVVVSAKTAQLRGRVSLRQLAPYPWVLFPEGGCIFRNALIREFRVRALDIDVAVSEFSVEQQLALVAAGAGIGLVPDMMVMASRYRKKLRILSVSDFKFEFSIWLIRARFLGNLTAAVTVFEDVVKQRFGREIRKR